MNAAVKLIDITSEEQGDFNSTTPNVLHFNVPAYLGVADLTNARVVMDAKVYCTDNSGESTLIPCGFAEKQGQNPVDNGGCQALIRNAESYSTSNGHLNTVPQQQNVYHANVSHYLKSTEQAISDTIRSGGIWYNDRDDNGITLSPFLELSRPSTNQTEVTTNSQQHYEEVYCDYKHVDSFGETMSQYPILAVGNTRIKVELERNTAVVAGVNPDTTEHEAEDMISFSSLFGNSGNPIKTKPFPTQGYKNFNKDQIPFWVGEPVVVSYTVSGSPNQTHRDTVSALEFDTSTGLLSVTLENGAPTTNATDNVTDITLALYVSPNATYDWNVREIRLVIPVLEMDNMQLDKLQKSLQDAELPWLETRLAKDVMSSQTYYNNPFDALPKAVAGVLLTPFNGQLVSGWDNADQYRWSINGDPVTRDIKVGVLVNNAGIGNDRQLHNYYLNHWFANMGKVMKRFDLPPVNYTGNLQDYCHAMYPLVLPLSDNEQHVGLEIQSNGSNFTDKGVYWYTTHLRSLRFKGGKLVSTR